MRPTPIGPSEVRRTERWLATARVSLAVSALFAVWMYPMQISWWAHWLLGIYVIHSTVVMLLFRFHKQSTAGFRALVHAADVIWPGLIYVFATGERNLFFLFFVFVLAAAAYRWGLWETVGTAAASLTLLWSESGALRHGLLATSDSFDRHHWPKLGINVGELEPKRLLILTVCLLVMGWLLGYLAEQHKRLRADVERTRIARELHDGTLQSLLGVKMRLEVLSASQEDPTAQELRQVQNILLEEARKLRELMHEVKPLDVDAKSLRPHLVEIVERFEREIGIRAQFVSDSSVVDIRQWVCDGVVRIVREALVNVRKHSCATHVLVRLDRRDNSWQLSVEDNGVGFPFSGRFPQSELEASGRGPLVIMECVRSIGGELILESNPGRGSKLEITIPAK